ncbi:MAG: exosortase/archaeosortase family protein [Planctomycetaceae bacterium]|jgi:exosortase|nr:exosortase/archaeosortase family protein [Planctomycetaceae bacterium]
MSDNQTNPNQSAKEEGGQRFKAQNLPAGEIPKRERADFTTGGGAQAKAEKHTPSGDAPRPVIKRAVVQRVYAPIDAAFEKSRLFILLIVAVPLCIWASLPAWGNITHAWLNSIDYGHGLLIIPLTAYFLYARRKSYPGTRYSPDWLGLFPIIIYTLMRFFAGVQRMDAIEEWSIFFWILGLVWFFYGTKVFLWALPSLCLLIFMFQLPFVFDVLMRNHLQAFAAQFAAVLLQIIGEPAIPIKNTIRLSTMELGVEAACSGLRFLISILAIAFAAVLFMRRPWWQNILIVIIAVPLALFVNASRIALTGILLMHFYPFVEWMTKEGQNPNVVADEFSGLVFAVVAVILFGVFIWYLGKAFRRVEV